MSILGLVTRGYLGDGGTVVSGPPRGAVPGVSPIVSFKATWALSAPLGFQCEVLGCLVTPRDLQVSAMADVAPRIPAGFLVGDTDPPPSVPSGVSFIDLDFVSVPQGFAVNES